MGVKVMDCQAGEDGGGHSHFRKLVVSRDVKAGELLFVQNALVFGKVEITRNDHVERLSDALVTIATTSPRSAAIVEAISNDDPLPEDFDFMKLLTDVKVVREDGPW